MMKLLAVLLLCTTVLGFPHEGHSHQQQQNRSSPDLLELSAAANEFTQDLYRPLILDKGQASAVLSPLSIHVILSLTSDGARGQTANEMQSVLNLDRLNVPVSDLYRQLMQQLNLNRSATLLANALYLKPGLRIRPEFLRLAKQDYNATVENIDLQAPGGPEKPINDYIAEQTKDNIQDMLQPGSVDAQTALLLINTLFFNSTWSKQFNPNETRPEDFHALNGSRVRVDMMRDRRVLPFKRDRNVSVMELAFLNHEYALYIALPSRKDGLDELEQRLTSPQEFRELFQGLEERTVNILLPKFRIESPYELKSALIQLGMQTAFNPITADFSGMIQNDPPRLHISDVDHKAVIEVQETGTVAAASTVVNMGFTSVVPAPEKFNADHSFLFFLRHEPTQQIISQGRFTGILE